MQLECAANLEVIVHFFSSIAAGAKMLQLDIDCSRIMQYFLFKFVFGAWVAWIQFMLIYVLHPKLKLMSKSL